MAEGSESLSRTRGQRFTRQVPGQSPPRQPGAGKLLASGALDGPGANDGPAQGCEKKESPFAGGQQEFLSLFTVFRTALGLAAERCGPDSRVTAGRFALVLPKCWNTPFQRSLQLPLGNE